MQTKRLMRGFVYQKSTGFTGYLFETGYSRQVTENWFSGFNLGSYYHNDGAN